LFEKPCVPQPSDFLLTSAIPRNEKWFYHNSEVITTKPQRFVSRKTVHYISRNNHLK
jgi:hypothetical protein